MTAAVERHVWLLGGLRMTDTMGERRIPAGKVRSLLAFLFLNPSAVHPREVLADKLWPDLAPERSRHNLANLLYQVRQALGSDWLVLDSDRVTLRVTPDLAVDVWEFERLVALQDPAALAAAVDCYRGELLPELYDDWVLARRSLLHERYLATLLRLGHLYADQHPDTACTYYRRLLEDDPLHESACRGLMSCLTRLGRLNEALATFNHLAARLDEELGADPEEATRQLVDQLRTESDLARQPVARPATLPFVGRTSERALLLARLEQVRGGHGGLLVVSGEVGSGKTRLTEELARAATWRQWKVAKGESNEFGIPAPFTPLGAALTAALPLARVQQIAPHIQPLWLSILSGMLPHLTGVTNSTLPQDTRWLPVALRHLFTALQQIAPHLLILDDVQWADPDVWELLEQLRGPLSELAVLVVLCIRSEEAHLPPAHEMLQRWEVAGVPMIRLGGLSLGELEEMATAQGRRAMSASELEQLANASGGNPLLVLSILQTGEPNRLLDRPSLANLVSKRLALLSPAAAQALRVASVLGYRFRYRVWAEMFATPLAVPLAALALELEQAGIIQLEGEGYRFVHDTLRAGTYAQIEERERKRLHQRALTVLMQLAPGDTGALLGHAAQAGDRVATARAALVAGEQALAGYAFRTALRYFDQALELLPTDELLARYRALTGRLRVCAIQGDRAGQREALAELEQRAEQLATPRYRAEVAWLRAEFAWQTGASEVAASAAAQAQQLAREAGEVRLQAQALAALSQVAQNRGNYPQAREELVKARALYRSLADQLGEAATTHNLALLAWILGDHEAAIAQYTTAVRLFREQGDLLQEARALNSLGAALWSVGDYLGAREQHQRAIGLCRDLGDRWGEDANTLNLGRVALSLGDYVIAIDHFSKALTGFQTTSNIPALAVCLSNLSSAYRLLGDYATSLSYCAEALRVSRTIGSRRLEGYAEHNRGLALMESGRYAEACAVLTLACAIRDELGERDNLVESQAGLALAHVQSNQLEAATTAIEQALHALDVRRERPVLRQWINYVAYQIFTARGEEPRAQAHVQQAMQAMTEAAAPLSVEERSAFLQQVALNRDTLAAFHAQSRILHVRLARIGVPLGRKLRDEDYVQVHWTIATPSDKTETRADERRRLVLRRLLSEAVAQGAVATDTDLATALDVNRRTVLRDMELLRAAGVEVLTRGRENDKTA